MAEPHRRRSGCSETPPSVFTMEMAMIMSAHDVLDLHFWQDWQRWGYIRAVGCKECECVRLGMLSLLIEPCLPTGITYVYSQPRAKQTRRYSGEENMDSLRGSIREVQGCERLGGIERGGQTCARTIQMTEPLLPLSPTRRTRCTMLVLS
ncbi:hypothetical protein BD310DRAFT_940665 [Dichomitus squalens]|uniref:Uncharacterized protein n=1 Tax=Dichomitus squalens TaxID=114155 RepID=A0A4Q9PG97_9APHY|nr:hypothetical protein BD310DRAFT_940665 [Dichomitus squalens]